jgi:hypothetical protein
MRQVENLLRHLWGENFQTNWNSIFAETNLQRAYNNWQSLVTTPLEAFFVDKRVSKMAEVRQRTLDERLRARTMESQLGMRRGPLSEPSSQATVLAASKQYDDDDETEDDTQSDGSY